MHILDNRYAIEYKFGNEKKHKICSIVSSILKVIAFVFIVLAFIITYYLYIGLGLAIILSLIIDVIGAQSIYTIQCVYKKNSFKIIKIALSGKETILEDIQLDSIKKIKIIENIYEFNENIYFNKSTMKEQMNKTCIEYSGRTIYCLTDNYMYSLLGVKDNDIFR